MATEKINGVRRTFGPYVGNGAGWIGQTRTAGEDVEVVVELDATVPAQIQPAGQGAHIIPAGSTVLEAMLFVEEAFVGGTALNVGVVGHDNTGGDPDGLFAAVAVGSLTAGAIVAGNGALLPKNTSDDGNPVNVVTSYVTVGAADLQFTYAATSGTPTAGKAKLVVRYVRPL